MPVTASFSHQGRDFTNVPVLNPGRWFGRTWLIEIRGSFTPLYLIVEADCFSDAIDELCDDKTYGPQIHVPESDLDDYPEDSRSHAGNDGRVVDLDWVMAYGPESRHDNPFPCVYHDTEFPGQTFTPEVY